MKMESIMLTHFQPGVGSLGGGGVTTHLSCIYFH